MTAIAAGQKRARRQETWKFHLFTLGINKEAKQGGLCAFDQSAGNVIPAEVQTDLIIIGHFAESVTTTGATKSVNVELFEEIQLDWFANDPTNPVLATDFGKPAYAVDDQTVSVLNTGRSSVGKIWGISATYGVAVQGGR